MNIEELLRRTLIERAARVPSDGDLAQNIIRQAHSRRGHRLLAGLFALLTVVVVVALAIAQNITTHRSVAPDPRSTATPSITTQTPTPTTSSKASSQGFTTNYRVIQGPDPITKSAGGAPIAVTPRSELRSTKAFVSTSGYESSQMAYLVTPTSSVALPDTVAQARSIQQAGTDWMVFTMSDSFTGGDTDADAKILIVSPEGGIRTLSTDVLRSVTVNPDGTEVASVETFLAEERQEGTTMSVQLVIRRIADGKVVRRVDLPRALRGSWPYGTLVWTDDGILVSDGYLPEAKTASTLLIRGSIVTEEAATVAVVEAPPSRDLFAWFSNAGSMCLTSWTAGATPKAILCGDLSEFVTHLGEGRVLLNFADWDSTRSLVVDTRAHTVTVLQRPTALEHSYLAEAVMESATSVLAQDEKQTWWRWDIETNTAENAPLPTGVLNALRW